MFDIDYNNFKKEVGVFKKYHNGYYTFELTENKNIIFEQIDSKISKEYQLKTNKYIDFLFEITYSEIFDVFESDEFIIFKLEDLNFYRENENS